MTFTMIIFESCKVSASIQIYQALWVRTGDYPYNAETTRGPRTFLSPLHTAVQKSSV